MPAPHTEQGDNLAKLRILTPVVSSFVVGSRALPGARPCDSSRTRLFVSADGNIASVSVATSDGHAGPVSRKYASPVAALPELLSTDDRNPNHIGRARGARRQRVRVQSLQGRLRNGRPLNNIRNRSAVIYGSAKAPTREVRQTYRLPYQRPRP